MTKTSNDVYDKNKLNGVNSDLWANFRLHLLGLNQSEHSIRSKVNYSKRYHHILESHNAQELLSCSYKTRVHTMKALASLSKFMGVHDVWKDIVQRYQLKWSDSNKGIKVFNAIFQNEGNTYSSMLGWIKEVTSVLPEDYQNVILFNTLTGLRPDEAQKAIWLIKNKESEYVDKDRGIIKHYQFPETFLRHTKNAYVSIINDPILEIAKSTPNKERYTVGLRKRFIKHGYKMNMYYCRKVFATYLRNKGIEPEIIDLLQGRISSSVFVNHYYRPDINEIITKRIRPVLDELRKDLTSL
ncbi:MAG: hypothetical protein L0H53_08590 [Candidatus Nitrosocosmicus sp.]|nr:hypothetical protein [Candidatus Nitrosocosmicus sp.]MDN5868133.1 hypothetical protein [Candidatus Nitrosocosmicus sp.]